MSPFYRNTEKEKKKRTTVRIGVERGPMTKVYLVTNVVILANVAVPETFVFFCTGEQVRVLVTEPAIYFGG